MPFFIIRGVANPIVKGIYTALRSSCFNVSCFFLTIFSSCNLSNTFCDVVVFLSSWDFAPKSQVGSSSGLSETSQRLLKEHAVVLPKVNTSPLVNIFVVWYDVGDETDRATGGCLTAIFAFNSFTAGLNYIIHSKCLQRRIWRRDPNRAECSWQSDHCDGRCTLRR